MKFFILIELYDAHITAIANRPYVTKTNILNANCYAFEEKIEVFHPDLN